jgi:hypothetical protein
MLPATGGSAPAARTGASASTESDGSGGVVVSHVVKGQQRKRCGSLEARGPDRCGRFISSSDHSLLSIRTLAGDMPFGRCLYNYELQIDSRGRTLLSGHIAAGQNPCNDVRPCVNADGTDWLPWRGRIQRTRDGRLVHVVDACVDNCLGQFKGRLVMSLERHRGWRATAERETVGSSGFTLSGFEWEWRIPGLEIRTSP